MSQIGVKYRVWCTTDLQWEFTDFVDLDDGLPTECPANPLHGITSSKTAIVERKGLKLNRSIPVTSSSGPYVSTTSATYVSIVRFTFPGTDAGRDPFKYDAIVSAGSTSPTMDVRVRDLTNALNIATKAGITFAASGTPYLIDLGALSNLPAARAIFDLRIKKATGSGNVRVSCLEEYI